MNEKIKELAEQSGFYFYDLHNIDGQDLGETIESDSWSCAEKFVELIVKECAQVCRDQPDIYALKADRDNCAIAIENHFGVE